MEERISGGMVDDNVLHWESPNGVSSGSCMLLFSGRRLW